MRVLTYMRFTSFARFALASIIEQYLKFWLIVSCIVSFGLLLFPSRL